MKLIQQLTTIILTTSLLLALIACRGSSRGESPVEPVISNIPGITDNLPVAGSIDTHSRSPMAVYEAVIDPDAETFTVTPVEREVSYHYPLLNLYPNALEVIDYGFTPNFWADIKLVHPLPGSGVDVFDPRVIAIVLVHAGAYFYYPNFNVYANNRIVLEPDGYTRLFNELAPDIFGNANPFIAYFKDEPYRLWSSTDAIEESKRWEMDLDGFWGDFRFILVVDISTNYPAPPEPLVDNAPEPIEIYAEVGDGLSNYGGTAPIEVRLKHWKDIDYVGGVFIEAPALLHDTMPIQYYSYSPYYDASIFRGSLPNIKLAPQGMHSLLVKSWDISTGIEMFNETSAVVDYIPRDGNLIGVRSAPGKADRLNGTAITTLSDNSVVVTGYFDGDYMVFGRREPNETILFGEYFNIFVARYNHDGTFEWAKGAGGPGIEYDHCKGIATLSDDSTVVTGWFNGIAKFGEGEPNETVLSAIGEQDVFIARYNVDGTLNWAKSAGGGEQSGFFPGRHSGEAVTTLSDDSVIVAGQLGTLAIFGEGEPNETILYNSESDDLWLMFPDIFIARYNPDGSLAWAKHAAATTSSNNCNAITTLPDDSTVMTGRFDGTITFGEGEPNETTLTSVIYEDIFIARFHPDGTLAWAKSAGGTSGRSESNAITLLSDDSIVVVGRFGGTITFGEGEPNETTLSAGTSWDSFTARYKSDGTLVWAKHIVGTAGLSGRVEAQAVTTLSDDSISVAGFYYRTDIIFGEGEPNETILSGGGTFNARYNSDGKLTWAKRAATTTACRDITVLQDDTTVLTGSHGYQTIFAPGQPNETGNFGTYGIFLARFEP